MLPLLVLVLWHKWPWLSRAHAAGSALHRGAHPASPAGAGAPASEENGLSSLRGIFSETRAPMRDLSDYADDADDRGDSRYSSPVYLKCLGQFMLKVAPLICNVAPLHCSLVWQPMKVKRI